MAVKEIFRITLNYALNLRKNYNYGERSRRFFEMKKSIKEQAKFTDIKTKDVASGKDELNLVEFPIALLSERVPSGMRTLEFKDQIFDSGKKKTLNRKLTIEGSETYGLPTAKDDEVILAFIQLSKRRGFDGQKLEFTRYDLLQVLGWPNTGQSYARIELSLRRWVSVTLHYENAWWSKSEERWTSGAFHIIDDFELNDSRETSSQLTLLPSRIIWSTRVFNSFSDGNLKNIRYDIYVKLSSAVSKRMFRFLDKRFYHSKTCNFELIDFACEHIGLSRSYKDCGKLKEKLQAGITELEEIGFIEPLSRAERYQQEGRGRWRIVFTRKQADASPAIAKKAALAGSLVSELTNRGVTEATASELVQRHSSDAIQAKIDVFDFLVEQKAKGVGKSPAGYLVKSIEMNYKEPPDYVSRAERERLAEAKRQADLKDAAEHRRKQEADKQVRKLAGQAKAYRQSRTPEQLAQLEADAIAQASGETRRTLCDPACKATRKTLVMMLINEHITRLIQAGELAVEPA